MTSNLYTWPASSARRIPVPVLGDDFSCIHGSHTYQWGGTFKDILPHTTNVTDYNMAEVGLGGQVLGLCGPAAGDCDPNNPTKTLRPSDIDHVAGIALGRGICLFGWPHRQCGEAPTTMTKPAAR